MAEDAPEDAPEDTPEDAAVVELQHNVALKEMSSQTVKMMMTNNLMAMILPLETMFLYLNIPTLATQSVFFVMPNFLMTLEGKYG
ncbi:hypothetical protein EVAR_47133_1 [Eumeta japonica]|uniref:Uncharacterized protein n=1 Tax=Eumeta variegata TaxID=151549 RepID=A0A4C1XYY5_EUMVA|nr:hypothetical protein EVAR_47133_1 [Eumeta japonica]